MDDMIFFRVQSTHRIADGDGPPQGQITKAFAQVIDRLIKPGLADPEFFIAKNIELNRG